MDASLRDLERHDRGKPVGDLGVEDLRVLIGLPALVPLAALDLSIGTHRP